MRLTVPEIPKEICLEILSYFDPVYLERWQCVDSSAKRVLLNLSSTCRFFSVVVLPWTFRTLQFNAEKDPGSIYAPLGHRSHISFCRALLDGDKNAKIMARYVKTCYFNKWFHNHAAKEWTFEHILSIYFRAIRLMPNLEQLYLSNTPITPRALQTIVSHPRLTSLKLRDCVLLKDAREKDLEKFRSLELKYLDVSFLTTDDSEMLPSQYLPGRLNLIFNINVASALEIKTNHPALIKRIGESPSPTQVLDLSSERHRFPSFFRNMPHLTTLKLDVDFSFGADIPPDAWPALKTIDVPFPLCKYIIPGRPIESIRTYGVHLPRVSTRTAKARGAAVLWSSSRPVTALQIPIKFFEQIPLWEHFPDLQLLTLEGSYKSGHDSDDDSEGRYMKDIDIEMEEAMLHIGQTISDALKTWPYYPDRLRTLVFDFFPHTQHKWDLDKQFAWISLVVFPLIPSLRCCRFFDDVQWVYWEFEDSWQPERTPRPTRNINRPLLHGPIFISLTESISMQRTKFAELHE